MDRDLLVRAAGLYLPLCSAAALWVWRRPGRREGAGALLALAWCLWAVPAANALALEAGWWRFRADAGVFLGMPVELWLGWAALWGAIPALLPRRVPAAVVVLGALALDVALMPLCAPVLALGERWLLGEAVALAVALVPALLLARWTAQRRRLGARAAMQAVIFGALLLWVVPAAVFAQAGGGWEALWRRPAWATSLLLQLLAVPAVVALSAVQEFARRGGGTPLPFDPPRRLVASGAYAYVSNPMQVGASLVMLGWGAVLESAWAVGAGAMAVAFFAGVAAWSEEEDLRGRFGEEWAEYRRHVRPWIPRRRPYHPSISDPGVPPARLYVAAGCGPCSEVGRFFASRAPVGMEVLPAEAHPARDLSRITYDPMDGTEEAEEEGVAAVGRALEHLGAGWALLGMVMRLPVVRPLLQVLADASGGAPRTVRRWEAEPEGGSARGGAHACRA